MSMVRELGILFLDNIIDKKRDLKDTLIYFVDIMDNIFLKLNTTTTTTTTNNNNNSNNNHNTSRTLHFSSLTYLFYWTIYNSPYLLFH